jgi:hypothetical protein
VRARAVPLNALRRWTRTLRLQTLEDIAAYYALEYTVSFPDGPVRLHGAQPSARTGAL